MSVRALIIDDIARQKVARVLEYAKSPEHWYEPFPGRTDQVIPGDNGNLQIHLDTYRVVFSYTKAEGKLWRHISISVPGGLYPNIIAVYTIAELFGFIGWDGHSEKQPDGWQGAVYKKNRCVVMAQEIKDGGRDGL